MRFRINVNSCKNALGTVFLLATAFFVCSTFISMRSVFADPIAPMNASTTQSGRQSPRSTSRTSNRTISRSTVSRGTTGKSATATRKTVSRETDNRTATPTRKTVARGGEEGRTVSTRSKTSARSNANVAGGATRGVVSRSQVSTRETTTNRAIRARSGTNTSRVAASGNVISASNRAGIRGVGGSYSYLNSRLNTGNYSNIVDSTTGLIAADTYSTCMDAYYSCMDEICTARNTTKGRCSCAGRATNFMAAEEALERANEELIVLSGQLSLLIATKGKGDNLAAAFSLTDAEKVMNCVSWRDALAKCKSGEIKAEDGTDIMTKWYNEHPTYANASNSNADLITGSCSSSSYTMPYYCKSGENGNDFGFDISSIDGSSSDILAQLKAWADAKDLAKQYTDDDTNNLANISQVMTRYVNGLADITTDTSKESLDKLANKWGYVLFEYAHNNVCGRVLDSCFNGIYEACGTPPTVTESDGETIHSKCMSGATSNCPYNFNSYIHVSEEGDIVLNERGSGTSNNATLEKSASCFGYSTTTTTTGRSTSASSDPYYSLRGPVADARRSIMQKYLLDANAACDTYGAALKKTAQNINYQKIAAQQSLQQKRLEFKTEEENAVLAEAKTAIDNFNECLSEIWDCYEQYQDEDTWTTARIKTYCSQVSQVPHCYETMICSPLDTSLTAVIDEPDSTSCTFSTEYKDNNCRNVVTLSEILYGTSVAPAENDKEGDILSALNGGSKVTGRKSAAIREACLQRALMSESEENCTKNNNDCLRGWKKPSANTSTSTTTTTTTDYIQSNL